MLVALTGGAGSGKSTVANFLRKHGITVIDLDKVGHETLELEAVKKKLVNIFGEKILNGDQIDRGKLRNIVFNSQKALKKLNEVVHPEMIKLLWRKIEELKDKKDIIVVDGALIPELGLIERFDFVVVVDVPKDIQIERLVKRNNISSSLALKIIDSQMEREEKLKVADYIIDASKNMDYTLKQAGRLVEILNNYQLRRGE
ncbi:MAG: dephospho-CoA kinase [Thermotogae bacterium]|nr:dephospho-CoA kinase [Thermotogota bacterium]